MNHYHLTYLILLITSCVSVTPGSKTINYCYPDNGYTTDSSFLPYPSITGLVSKDTLINKRYSITTLQIANATGVFTLLSELTTLQYEYSKHPATLTEIAILSKKQQISDRLIICRTEIAGIAAELDCEGERADQLSNYMSGKEDKRVNRLTVASITLGALTAVTAVLIKQKNASDAVAVTGGLGSASLGLLALSSNRKTAFMHPRNLLTDIWNEPAVSSYYPATIWYLLTHKEFSNNKQFSICHNTRERWLEYEQLENKKPKKQDQLTKLFFGSGGVYTSDQLHTRADMLNQLQAAIKLLDQDIQQLLYVMNKP